jgi:hypothetical protein
MENWQHYWKGILGFLVPGAVIIGSSVTGDSDGGSTITTAEWVTAVVAMIVTGGLVVAKANAPLNQTPTAPPAPTADPTV